jgi:transposase
LVFVDESGIRQGERLAYGYAPRGERCHETAPFRTGKRVNLLGWMLDRGGQVAQFTGRVTGAQFTGRVTGALFTRWVKYVLVPQLEPDDVVIWDNARIHMPSAVELVRGAGADVLALPRYSPEFNAIEMLWSKVKQSVRSTLADTAEQLTKAVKRAVEAVTSSDALGWVTHCGYRCQPT